LTKRLKIVNLYLIWERFLAKTLQMNQAVCQHYNFERPNQACSCGNQPPRAAFPDLPSLPQVVDPDGWLKAIDGRLYIRRVNSAGTVKVDKRAEYHPVVSFAKEG
jgi:hypothetical protein